MACVEWPELTEQMSDALKLVAAHYGVNEKDAEHFALDAAKAITYACFSGGGATFYIPSVKTIEKRQRNISIRHDALHMTLQELMKKYPDLSEQRLRYICQPTPKRKKTR